MIQRGELLLSVLGFVVLASGCNGDGLNGNTNSNANGNVIANPSSLAGQLTVISRENHTTITEAEPNDSLNGLAAVATVHSDDRIKIFGNVSVENGDVSDNFVFNVEGGPLEVKVILTFDFNPVNPAERDVALGFSDLQTTACQLGTDSQMFTECVNTEKNPERATFIVNGNFGLTVVSLSGDENYALGLEFRSSGANGASAPFTVGSRVLKPEPMAVQDQFVPSHVLVRFKSSVRSAQQATVLESMGLEVLARSPSGVYLLRSVEGKKLPRTAQFEHTRRLVQQVQRHREIQMAEPNGRYYPTHVPNDTYYSYQWHYGLINLPDAWDITTGSSDVVVAVVDTGVVTDHPDLAGRLVSGYDFISDSTSARDGDGVDPDPYDMGDLSGGPGASSFHGTHVSGTIGAATDNDSDVAGVTWGCKVMPVRALGVGGGTSFDIAEAIRFAAGMDNVSGTLPEHSADIINMSLASPAGSPPSTTMGDAVAAAAALGVVIVAAAGNEATSAPAYPASYDHVISVAACDPQFKLAPYSNFGSTIDITAPGGNLSVDYNGDGYGDGVLSLQASDLNGTITTTLGLQHGTSMASPHVAGVVALMKSVYPAMTADEALEILTTTARDVGDPGVDDQFGAGVVDAALAVNEAAVRGGAIVSTIPKLSLSAHSVDFGTSLDELMILVTNTGGATLDVQQAQVTELDGSGWLSASLLPSSGNSNASAVIVSVVRDNLQDGIYYGQVLVTAADLTPQTIDVAVTVGDVALITDTIYVVLLDSTSRASIAQDRTTIHDQFAYGVINLLPGTYKVYAGTDRDNDGYICDIGELCGGYPSSIEANAIIVSPGDNITGIDFPIGELIFQTESSGPRNTMEPIRLMK